MKDHLAMSPHASEASSAAGYVTLRAPSPMREPTTLHEILDSMDPSDPLSSVASFPQEAAYDDELPAETTPRARRLLHIMWKQRRRYESREAV